MTGAGLTLRLERRPNPLNGPRACSIIVEGPGFHPCVWRGYKSEVACRAAAAKLAAKTPQTWGTIAQQMGGAIVIDQIEETTK